MHEEHADNPTTPPPPPRGDTAAPLRCPACGYNLTGVCTTATPEGNCPECGRAFVRKALQLYASRRAYQPNLTIALIAWPALFAFILPFTTCCSLGLFMDVPGVGFILAVAVPLLACWFSGWYTASRVVEGARVGREFDELPAFYRHLFWPWLLFTSVHAVLTIVFFAGGCALILGLMSV